MKFLNKLSEILRTGLQWWTGFRPVVEAFLPDGAKTPIKVVSQDLAQIADIVVQVELMGEALGLPGAQKLIAASPLAQQVILKSALLVNHKIHDEVLFKQGVSKVTDGMADIINSLKNDIETVNKT